MKRLLFVGVLVLVYSASAFADFNQVPEIDASSVPTVLALVSSGILLLRSKSRSK